MRKPLNFVFLKGMKIHTNIRFLLFSGLLYCANLKAQFARFNHLTVEEGLSQNAVTCIIQDKKGFMWIGTYSGLNKYDGIRVTTYLPDADDSSAICNGAIRCLYADDENNLWAGTAGGMFKIELSTGRITNYRVDSLTSNGLSNEIVNCIEEFEPGLLYIGTNDGLNIFDKASGEFTVYRKIGKNRLPFLSDRIKQMVRDDKGYIWFSHYNAGITRYHPVNKHTEYYSNKEGHRLINSNTVRSIYLDKKGFLWVSCWNTGGNIIDIKSGKIYSSKDSLHVYKALNHMALVSQFCEDNKGNIWWATAEKGLACISSDYNIINYFESNPDDRESMNDNTVFSVFQDKSGLLWAGTWQGGVNTLNLNSLLLGYYKHESNNANSLTDNTVYTFAQKSENEIYIGHASGVDVFNVKTKSFSKFPINEKDPESLRKNSIVTGIYSDPKDNSVWFSTSGGYPYRYFTTTKRYKNYISKGDSTSFGHHTSYSIQRDKAGKLWIASSAQGLYLFNDEKGNFTAYKSVKGDVSTLSSDNLSRIIPKADGNFWVITTDAGINLFNTVTGKSIQYLKNKSGKSVLKDGSISASYLSKAGQLWLGTSDGLAIFDDKTEALETFKNIDKIFQSDIQGITEDKHGVIWAATDKGLIQFNYRNKSFKVYRISNGLQGKEFSTNAAITLSNGMLVFGGNNGFNAFYPGDLNYVSAAPEVVFTDFSVLNRSCTLDNEITYTDEVTLSYRDYFFSFDFAALDFTNASQNNYEYKLEGFNENWVSIGNKHQVTFTNLDAGKYTLLVRACNSDGIWCKEPASIKLVITPPFWKTKWFYTMCVLSGVLIVYLYIRWREKKLIKEKTFLENKVAERTRELKEEKQKVEDAHKEIKDSINYAKRIQEAILPLKETIDNYLKEYFILYKPKDIVAGDFYWFYSLPQQNSVLIAAVDCTGHGVPGAFMSMIGNEQLTKIINEKNISQPDLILNELHKGVRAALKQDQIHAETRDGMDIALCKINLKENYVEYAGAMRPFWMVRDNVLHEVKADKQPIGGLDGDYRTPFTNNRIDLQKGDTIYLFTDGYADQFGGEKGKKFMIKNFSKFLLEVNQASMDKQQQLLNERIENWKGNHEQIDDILVIGIKIT